MHALRIINKDGQAPTAEEITAANKVATTFKAATIGTFKVIDPIDDIEVEYHAHKALAFTQGGSSIYFGFSAQVEMRCRCRGVVLAETAAPEYVSPYVGTGQPWAYQITPYDVWAQVGFAGLPGSYITKNGVFAYSSEGTYFPDLMAYGNFYYGSGQSSSNLTSINYANTPGQPVTAILTQEGMNADVSSTNAAALAAAQAAADAQNAVLAAAAHQRSAVFLTDGTELVSARIERTVIQEGFLIYEESNTLPYKNWLGGSQVPLYVRTKRSDSFDKYTQAGFMSFEVPSDACPSEFLFGSGFYHLGDENKTIYRIGRDNSIPSISDVSYGGYYSKQVGGVVVNQEIQMSVLIDIVNNQITPSLNREYQRRKKCSDGQMAYLRNGFMSPEIERFVKANHPVSNLLRRDIPMQIISEPVHTLINEERNEGGALIASTYECRLTLKYLVETKEYQKEFIGQVRFTEYTATYTNYPLLGFKLNGTATPEDSDFRGGYNVIHQAITNQLHQSASLRIIHDGDSYYPSLFCEVNGTGAYNERWFDEFYEMGPTPGAGYLPGEIVKTSYDNVIFSYPQFLLDYIAASKPIETEIDENGNKVPVTPSTDWLSSRLTDKEVIKVIPLNHVGNSYGNYGMFPLMQRDAEDNLIVNELRIYGYAEFQYSAETTSFTFKKWVELIDDGKLTILADDEVSLDDDLNPTTISVTSNGETKTYNLAPKSFEYDEEWGATNCVCIGNKAIWSDVKADAKEQKKNISNNTPEGHELTAEEKLYKAVREAIA